MDKIKLTVRFGDHGAAIIDMINTGVMPPIQWRTVTIDLTIAQVEALEKKQHERFEVVSLEYAYEREAEHE